MRSRRHTGLLAAFFAWLLAASVLVACGGGGSDVSGATGSTAVGGSPFGNGVVNAGNDSGPGGTGVGGDAATSASSGGSVGDGTGVADAGGIGGTGGADPGGGGIGGTGSPASVGGVRFLLTDAPACGYEAVYVTVEQVSVHQSSSAAPAAAGWAQLVLDTPQRIDLLTLVNGKQIELGQVSLPSGRYTQLRLVLADNDAAHPLANAVVPDGGAETPLDTPSGSQSGIRINVDVDVAPGSVTDVLLDFNACKSLVERGKSGRYNLKPFITVLPGDAHSGAGVTGQIATGLAGTGTQVSLQRNGVPVRATHPDAGGRFVLSPVPAGVYDLVIAAPGHATAVVTGVPVVAGQATTIGAAIDLPKSAVRSVSGTVTPATASLRAVQTLADGRAIEVDWAPVDPTSGAFAFGLPVAAPSTASFVPNRALAFVAEPPPSYTIEAATGTATKTQSIDVAHPVPALTFALP